MLAAVCFVVTPSACRVKAKLPSTSRSLDFIIMCSLISCNIFQPFVKLNYFPPPPKKKSSCSYIFLPEHMLFLPYSACDSFTKCWVGNLLLLWKTSSLHIISLDIGDRVVPCVCHGGLRSSLDFGTSYFFHTCVCPTLWRSTGGWRLCLTCFWVPFLVSQHIVGCQWIFLMNRYSGNWIWKSKAHQRAWLWIHSVVGIVFYGSL